MNRYFWLATLSLALIASTSAAVAHQDSSSAFDFHSGFWMNLHQFIYAEASSTAPARTGPSLRISQTDTNTLQQLRPTERATWNSIVSYYTTNYIQRDLLSDNTLYDIKHKLEAAEGSPDLKGADISPELKSLLLRAAPIYRRYWWNGERAAGIYSLIGAAKLNDVDLEA